jgi:hypothetical protein
LCALVHRLRLQQVQVAHQTAMKIPSGGTYRGCSVVDTIDKNKPDPDSQEAFRIRMNDQCLHIEQYRLAVLRTEGRCLSEDEAGLEWVDRHAEAFDRSASTSPGAQNKNGAVSLVS